MHKDSDTQGSPAVHSGSDSAPCVLASLVSPSGMKMRCSLDRSRIGRHSAKGAAGGEHGGGVFEPQDSAS